MERASVYIPVWPAIVSGLLYAATLNGVTVPLWLILLPLVPYFIASLTAVLIVAFGIIVLIIDFCKFIK